MMVKSRIFLLIIYLILSIKGVSQMDNKTDTLKSFKNYLGINLGISNNFHSVLIDGKSFVGSNKVMSLGENFTRTLNKRWEFTFEAAVQIGGVVKNNFYTRGEKYSYEMFKTSINFPISFRYLLNNNKKVSWSPHFIQFGPVFSYNLTADKQIKFDQFGNNEMIRRDIPNFENGYTTSLRIGTGYTFQLKYSFIRAELNYTYGFNSLKKNTIPLVNLTKVTNDAIGINVVIENRSILSKKVSKFRIGPIRSWFSNHKEKTL